MLPLDVRRAPLRCAERVLYNSFQSQLDDSFLVFYSRLWRRHSGGAAFKYHDTTGECDFIIVAARYGILCVECKGGAISRERDQFCATDKLGRKFAIKNPYEQVLRSKYHLLQCLKEFDVSRFCSQDAEKLIQTAVFFPESLAGNWCVKDISFPLDITGFSPDVADIREWVHRVCKGTLGDRCLKEIDDTSISSICSALSPSGTYEFSVQATISDVEGFYTRGIFPTSQQWFILEQLRFRKNVLVIGAAGTGKTLLALEYLKRASLSTMQAVYLCSSGTLANELTRKFDKSSICGSIRSLAMLLTLLLGVCREYGIDVGECNYEQLIDRICVITPFRIQLVIVDEMQDIPASLVMSLRRLCGKDGQFIGFYDPEQAVFDEKTPLDIAMKLQFDTVDTLLYNLRNTPEIAAYFMSKCPSIIGAEVCAPSGLAVVEIEPPSDDARCLIDIAAGILSKLAISASSLCVLVPSEFNRSTYRALLSCDIARGYVSPSLSSLRISTFADFKGLESLAVLVWCSKQVTEIEMYVACSRARTILYVARPASVESNA